MPAEAARRRADRSDWELKPVTNDPAIAIAHTPEIEFWFEFGSSYSYLSVMRIEEEA
jgi:hypothetical protein